MGTRREHVQAQGEHWTQDRTVDPGALTQRCYTLPYTTVCVAHIHRLNHYKTPLFLALFEL